MGILIRFVVTFAAVFVADLILPADLFQIENMAAGFLFAVVLATVNALIRPVVLLLTCPIQLLTLGLASLVVNALMFLLAERVASLFQSGVVVGGFLGAFVGAIVVGLIGWGISLVVKN